MSGRAGGCPPAAAGVDVRPLTNAPSRRTEDGHPPARPRPRKTPQAPGAPPRPRTGRRRHKPAPHPPGPPRTSARQEIASRPWQTGSGTHRSGRTASVRSRKEASPR
ncbi:hypothetical protein DWC19_02135 [Streptomyces sp. M7]|nr:hypothetical protein DWC19_02135 [Streptomyces sp. M7]